MVTLTFQLCGTIWFVLPEVLVGCPNMHPIGFREPVAAGAAAGAVGAHSCLGGHDGGAYDVMYFWFAVGVNVVWVLVPLAMLRAAAARGAARKAALALLLQANEKKTKRS